MPKDLTLFYLTLHEWLMPWEDVILRIQSLILWQRPIKSLIFTLVIHGLYWYFVWQQYNSLVVLAGILFIIHLIDFWKHFLWPLITADSLDADSLDAPLRYLPFLKWQQRNRRSGMWDTKGGRHLLTVHEICTHINSFVLRFRQIMIKIYYFRLEHSVMFFLISSTFFLFTAYIGLYIYARTILYALLTFILLIPSASYHKLDTKLHSLISPWLTRLDAEITSRVQFECPKQAEAEELAFQPSLKAWKRAFEREISYREDDDIITSHEDDLFIEQNFNLRPIALFNIDEESTQSNSAPIRDTKRLSLLDSAITDEADEEDGWDLDQQTDSQTRLRHFADPVPVKHLLTTSEDLPDEDNGFEIIDCP